MIGAIDILDAETDACHEASLDPERRLAIRGGMPVRWANTLGNVLPCKHDGHPLRFLGMFEICQRWERLCEDVTREEVCVGNAPWCVEAALCPSTARWMKKARIAGAPMSVGWRW